MFCKNSLLGLMGAFMLACTLLLTGCETSEPGVSDVMGRYDMTIDAPTVRVTQVAANVLESDYRFKIDSSAYTTIDGKVTAHTAQDMKVWVWVEQAGDNMSKISIRVGDLGDEHLSMEILNKVKDDSKSITAKIREKIGS